MHKGKKTKPEEKTSNINLPMGNYSQTIIKILFELWKIPWEAPFNYVSVHQVCYFLIETQ